MSKKLKIQFWKAENTLAMQILKQEGLPSCKEEGFTLIEEQPALYEYSIDLRGHAKWANLRIPYIEFNNNTERDEYLQKSVNAITEELFLGNRELKIGEMCKVSEDRQNWVTRRLLAILPENYESRFIAGNDDSRRWGFWSYARPIVKRIEPTVEECGQLITYTWEEK